MTGRKRKGTRERKEGKKEGQKKKKKGSILRKHCKLFLGSETKRSEQLIALYP
jgi:hypothetical protein